MINEEVVYKIKLIAINHAIFHLGDEWANGVNIYKRGGSGKTWTSKKLVNKSFKEITDKNNNRGYGVDFLAEIVTFNLKQISSSKEAI